MVCIEEMLKICLCNLKKVQCDNIDKLNHDSEMILHESIIRIEDMDKIVSANRFEIEHELALKRELALK